ncbi:MAG: ferredoxin--NADP reductase [Paludibacteraceae bacterium]
MEQAHKLNQKKITAFRQVASNVYVLSYARGHEFTSGQIVAIDVEPNGTPRLYSIASGEREKEIDILFDEKPEGKLTPIFSKLEVGAEIYVSEAFGDFRCDDADAWWIASGTGVAPFVSMLRSGMGKGKKLIHGARFDENFYFSDVIEKELGENYIRCASQDMETNFYRGRLTHRLRDLKAVPKEIRYYLCGSPEMVVEVRDILIQKEIPFQNIISETYF